MEKLFSDVKNNLSFIGVCLLVFFAIFTIASLSERFVFQKNIKKIGSAQKAAFIGLFSAVSGVLMLFEIPLFFAPAFYKIDLSEIPVLMSAFYLGPVAGVVTELFKIIVKIMLKGTTTAFVGDFANFVIGCSFVLPAAIIYHIKKNKNTALIGMAAGTVCMSVFGSLFNAVYLLPTFAVQFGLPLDVIIAMGTAINPAITSVSTLVLFAVVPFNILKGVVVSILTFFLYKRVECVLFRKDIDSGNANMAKS